MRILLIDPVCPKIYGIENLKEGRMGGTEAAVCKLARELSYKNEVVLEQRGRVDSYTDSYKVSYIPLKNTVEKPDVVITLRDGVHYRDAEVRYPNSKHYMWMHDYVSGEYQSHLETELKGRPSHLLAVSNWHKAQMQQALSMPDVGNLMKISVLYNMVDDYCTKTNDPYDSHKLIFFSSPHKGLKQVLEVFGKLRAINGKFTLYIGNPGYYADEDNLPEGVFSLTPLKLNHEELMDQVRSSLCLFYPQTVFPETFGLVYAEANAVGTPAISHDIGAAREVLDNQAQITNCNNHHQVISRVLEWSKGYRPTVSGNKLFTVSEVMKSWNKLIRFGSVG